ncbi:MAG: hypothetical protein QOH88_1413 [Verrucomicrobiota bacterium]
MKWILIVAAVICEGFAYWGLETRAGRAAFDEMAGMIPLAAAPIGLCFAAAALLLWWRGTRAGQTP